MQQTEQAPNINDLRQAHAGLEVGSGKQTVKNLLRTPDGRLYGLSFNSNGSLWFLDVDPNGMIDGMANGTTTYRTSFRGLQVETRRDGRYEESRQATEADMEDFTRIMDSLTQDGVKFVGTALFIDAV